MYKAVISDLDGTLLNDRSKISDFTRETVRELIDKGIKFYIATGRTGKIIYLNGNRRNVCIRQ